MHIPLTYEHLFYKRFVRRYDGYATQDRDVKLLKHDLICLKLRQLIFTVYIPLLCEHLFYKYFVCLLDGYTMGDINVSFNMLHNCT